MIAHILIFWEWMFVNLYMNLEIEFFMSILKILKYIKIWHSPKLPGLGGVDFAAFVSALNDIEFKGCACIEVEDRAYESSIEDVKYGIETSYRYLSQFVGE